MNLSGIVDLYLYNETEFKERQNENSDSAFLCNSSVLCRKQKQTQLRRLVWDLEQRSFLRRKRPMGSSMQFVQSKRTPDLPFSPLLIPAGLFSLVLSTLKKFSNKGFPKGGGVGSAIWEKFPKNTVFFLEAPPNIDTILEEKTLKCIFSKN